MQAIILAAGESSRFYPFNSGHKSLVKVLGKTIIEHTLLSIKKTGIEDVIIVIGKDSKIKENLEGKNLGLNIQYVIQPKSEGMGDALLLCEKYIKSDFFLAPHHVDFLKFKDVLESKRKETEEIILLVKKINVLDLQKFGVLRIDGDRVLEVVEKPSQKQAPSNLGIIGIYLLNKAFVGVLKKTPKEHYNFEKSISLYAEKGVVKFMVTDSETVSLKFPWEILNLKDHMLAGLKRYAADTARVASSAQVLGEVYVDDNAQIMENAVIKGPCYIGKNAFVGNNAVLRNGVDVEDGAVVGAHMEVKNSILMENCKVHSGFIGDSVIGKNCRIGAGFNTANVRLDRETVKTVVKNEKIDTGLKSLGAMVGEGTHIGIKSSTMPGVIIGRGTTIGAGTTVLNNVPDNTKYYTKFQELVVKKMKKQKMVLFDIDYTLFDTGTFKNSNLTNYALYNETLSELEKLSKIASLGIFSKGNTEFQNDKLQKTGLRKFFQEHNIHIFDDKDINLKNVLEKYKEFRVFLIDDKLTILYSAKLHMPYLFTVWVKRGPFAENQEPIKNFSPDVIINSLLDLNKIVETN